MKIHRRPDGAAAATIDKEREGGTAVRRNGGLAGEGRHQLGGEKPLMMMKMESIRGATATSGQPKKTRKAFLMLLADQTRVTGGGCAVSDAEDDR